MKKQKCYVLILSETFSKTHPRAGEPTGFPLKVKHQEKIHTIRENYDFWKKRMEEIDQGNAYLSVRVWTGLPYRSKQQEIFRFDRTQKIGIQKLEFTDDTKLMMSIDGMRRPILLLHSIAKNDGLAYEDYHDWFAGVQSTTLAIIHFTDFRY